MYLDIRGPASARPIVLCHGCGTPPASLEILCDALSDDYRVIVPHFPGYALEPAAPEVSFDEVIAKLAGQLASYDTGRMVVIGHSFGLYRAVRLLEHMELAMIIGIGGVGSMPKEASQSYEDTAQWLRRGEGVAQGLVHRLFAPEYIPGKPHLEQIAARWWQQCDVDAVCQELSIFIDGGRHNSDMARTKVPFVLLHGELDQAVPLEHAHQLASLGEHIRLTVLEGLGHTPYMEAPERTMALIRAQLDTLG